MGFPKRNFIETIIQNYFGKETEAEEKTSRPLARSYDIEVNFMWFFLCCLNLINNDKA